MIRSILPTLVLAALALPAAAGPQLEIASIGADGQAVMAQGTFSGYRFRVMRSGAPVAGAYVNCSSASGPYLGGQTNLSGTTDANGELALPSFQAKWGYGAGVLRCSTYDNLTSSYVQATAKYVVTYPDGRTSAPLAPLWFDASAPGWGLSLPQHEDRVFPVLFTYRNGTPIWYLLDGKWYTGFAGGFNGNFLEYKGAPYFAFDTTKVSATPHTYGDFGFLTYAPDKVNIEAGCAYVPPGGFDPLPSCIGFARSIVPFAFAPAVPQAEHGVSDIWWGGPSQSGWGISIAEDHGNLFLAWFTYDANGSPTWFVMPEGQWTDASTWKGGVYRTSGDGLYIKDRQTTGIPYSAAKLGDFTLRFSGTTAATFTYNVDGHAGTLDLKRFDY